jgi:hypothetical protein
VFCLVALNLEAAQNTPPKTGVFHELSSSIPLFPSYKGMIEYNLELLLNNFKIFHAIVLIQSMPQLDKDGGPMNEKLYYGLAAIIRGIALEVFPKGRAKEEGE